MKIVNKWTVPLKKWYFSTLFFLNLESKRTNLHHCVIFFPFANFASLYKKHKKKKRNNFNDNTNWFVCCCLLCESVSSFYDIIFVGRIKRWWQDYKYLIWLQWCTAFFFSLVIINSDKTRDTENVPHGN